MRKSAFAVLLLVWVGNLTAQPASFVPFEGLVNDLRSLPSPNQGEIASELTANIQEFVWYSLGPTVYTAFVEQGRIDKQIGASAGNSGSTSLVSKGSVPALIGVAVESGSLYQSVSGNIVTFRLNPAGFVRALAKHSYLLAGASQNESALKKAISPLSVSASFDFQQGSTPGTFTGERSQLKEFTTRISLINKRDPRHPDHTSSIRKVSGDMNSLVGTVQALFDRLRERKEYVDWQDDSVRKLQNVDLQDETALFKVIIEIGDKFREIFKSDQDLRQLGRTMVENVESYRKTRDDVFETFNGGYTLSVEYTFSEMEVPEEGQAMFKMMDTTDPSLSTGRVIFSSPIRKMGEVTLNASMTIFNSTLPQMKGRLRDMQIAGSMDYRFPEIHNVGRPVITLALLGAYLHQQPFGVKVKIRDVETKDGIIGVLQAKLTFPTGRSGAKIPLSVSVTNRSEFNTEAEVRGSIGLTFDLDTLFSRL